MKARELGLQFGTYPTGRFNSITDVPGVTVGQVSLIHGQGQLIPGKGPVRTGVTAVLPHGGNLYLQKCPAAVFPFNGYGKSVGLMYVQEMGLCENPILITNTLSIAAALEGGIDWVLAHNPGVGIWERTPNICVFECDDGYLNDIRGRHVTREHFRQAIAKASGGPVLEGNVGAGVGMSAFDYKSGVGTVSRTVNTNLGTFSIGILMVSNFGVRKDLIIKGIPLGELFPYTEAPYVHNSNITIIATDAPLSKMQLERLAKRPVLGLARTGFISRHGSGDLVLAFSNYRWVHNTDVKYLDKPQNEEEFFDAFVKATVEAGEEAVLNALFQAESMTGRDNHFREKLPVNKVLQILNQNKRDLY